MPAAAKTQPAKTSRQPEALQPRGGAIRTERNCSVARTLDIVSDAWAFLIIREAFFGTQTFEAFRSALGIPRATLTDQAEEADPARHLPPGRARILAAQRVPTDEDGVRSLSKLHRADAIRGPVAHPRRAAAAHAGPHDMRLRQPSCRHLLRIAARACRRP